MSVDGGLTGQELVGGDETRVRLVSAEDGRAGMWADQIQLPAPPQIQADSVAEAGHSGVVVLDLPTALALVGGQHPVVGFAQWRVQEANARWDQAHVLWLPNLQAGTSVSRHDGQLQDTEGRIRDVNRSSLQAGLGAGAVGAGTTQYPGIAANFAISDAIFAPRIAQKTSWARQHGATTAFNDQLLRVAIAYVRLLAAKQDKLVLAEIHQRTSDLATLTRNFAETGQGLQADADRLQTETILVKNRLLESSEREQIAVARLIEAASLAAC